METKFRVYKTKEEAETAAAALPNATVLSMGQWMSMEPQIINGKQIFQVLSEDDMKKIFRNES